MLKKIDNNFLRAIVAISGPAEVESLYVKILKDDIYEVASIPFFAYNISLGDLVKCVPDEEGLGLFVENVIKKSGNKTIRVRFGGLMEIKHPKAEALIQYLSENNIQHEIFVPRIISFNIPFDFDLQGIENMLNDISTNVEGANWEMGDPDPEVAIDGTVLAA